MDNLEVSIVMPCLNEEKGIVICLNKIKEVFMKEHINGEIIIADNGSIDRSRAICEEAGARVFIEPIPGYGSAYLRGLKEARGQYIVIADSDNTYDFSDIPEFLKVLKSGYDFVIGSRFKGKIKHGAMPWVNRYIGNPILSGMTRLFFRSRLSDIHCGMRAFTAEAYRKMNLRTPGMEFATEMVVAALTNNLRTKEIPINYHPRYGDSKLAPFYDAWRHVRFMLLYCPLWLYFIPGLVGFLPGIFFLLFLSGGPVIFLGHYWDIHFLIFFSALTILSYQVMSLGVFAHVFAINEGFIKEDRLISLFRRKFNLEKGLIIGIVLFVIGFGINLLIFMEWFSNHFGALYRIRESVLALTLLVIGVQTIFGSFFISLLTFKKR